MRWDFGFTCGFCLLHEADLFGGESGEGLGGTTVEHAIARSADASRQGDYDNCLYACRFCNRSRSAKPPQHQGARLLDPTRDGWHRHFIAAGNRLQPEAGDLDAAYTHRAYQLDDPRKVERRRGRRELINDRLRLLAALEGQRIPELLALADELRQLNRQGFGDLLRAIQQLRADARRALQDLRRYEAIPRDAPTVCRCGSQRHHTLPDEFEEQSFELPSLVAR